MNKVTEIYKAIRQIKRKGIIIKPKDKELLECFYDEILRMQRGGV